MDVYGCVWMCMDVYGCSCCCYASSSGVVCHFLCRAPSREKCFVCQGLFPAKEYQSHVDACLHLKSSHPTQVLLLEHCCMSTAVKWYE